jgi:hypothetical protein
LKRSTIRLAAGLFTLLLTSHAFAVGIFFRAHDQSLTEPSDPLMPWVTSVALAHGEKTLIEIVVDGIVSGDDLSGLAVVDFRLSFDPGVLAINDPNAGFPGLASFAPLEGALCGFVRGTGTCGDPDWFLTSTGRDVIQFIDDSVSGELTVSFGTTGDEPTPTGTGVVFFFEVEALDPPVPSGGGGAQIGWIDVTLDNVLLGNAVPSGIALDPTNPVRPIDPDVRTLALVPLPSSMVVLLSGLAVLVVGRRRQWSSRTSV